MVLGERDSCTRTRRLAADLSAGNENSRQDVAVAWSVRCRGCKSSVPVPQWGKVTVAGERLLCRRVVAILTVSTL